MGVQGGAGLIGDDFRMGGVFQDRENRGAGAAHEGSVGGGVFEQPLLEFREEAVFGEDRSLKVVAELSEGEFLRAEADPTDLEATGEAPVGVHGGDAERGLEKQNGEGIEVWGWMDDLTPPCTPGWAGGEEKGNVGADPARDLSEGIHAQHVVMVLVEREEGGGGVAAAAPESGTMGDALFEVDVKMTGPAGRGFESADGLDDEIGFPGWEIGIVAREGEGVRSGQGELVSQSGEGDHERFEIMVSIRPFAEDLEKEVELRRGVQGEGCHGREGRHICRPAAMVTYQDGMESSAGGKGCSTSLRISAIIRPVTPFSIR
jgi:hypothetical protein